MSIQLKNRFSQHHDERIWNYYMFGIRQRKQTKEIDRFKTKMMEVFMWKKTGSELYGLNEYRVIPAMDNYGILFGGVHMIGDKSVYNDEGLTRQQATLLFNQLQQESAGSGSPVPTSDPFESREIFKQGWTDNKLAIMLHGKGSSWATIKAGRHKKTKYGVQWAWKTSGKNVWTLGKDRIVIEGHRIKCDDMKWTEDFARLIFFKILNRYLSKPFSLKDLKKLDQQVENYAKRHFITDETVFHRDYKTTQ